MTSGVALEIVSFGVYTFALGIHEAAGLALITHGCTYAMQQRKDINLGLKNTANYSFSYE